MSETNVYKVGYARIDTTPQESVPMAGYGNTSARLSQGVMDPLYATCIAFSDESGKVALVYTIDLINSGKSCTTEIRPAISAATGVPVELIQCSGTHTHAGPDTLNMELESAERYRQFQKVQMVQAAKEAIADLKPAKLYMTSTRTQNLNFVRRYIMEDGSFAGPNYGNWKLRFVAHESEVDNLMQLVKITREGGKDIIICNYGVHQTHTGGMQKLLISADVAGEMRKEFEANQDCLFAYFTGACGNVVPSSNIDEENIVTKFDHVGHGKALAKYALAAQDYQPAAFGPIRARCDVRQYAINHTTDHLADKGREAQELYTATYDRVKANELARSYGFSSVYHAGAVWRRKDRPESEPITLNTLTVGDLAFAMAPYEMFCDNGVEIREGSPFKMTMVCTLANQGSIGYMPTRLAFRNKGYEPDTCAFMPGIGEELAQRFIAMCRDMYEEK